MIEYALGTDEFLTTNQISKLGNNFKWCVSHYRNEGYAGCGDAIFLGQDNNLYELNLGHCSCNDPIDDLRYGKDFITKEQFLTNNHVLINDISNALYSKVIELLNETV